LLLVLVELLTSLNELMWEVSFVNFGGIVYHHSMSTKITSHFNSLSDDQQFHQYQQKSPLILTHWMMVNNPTNINKNHLSPKLIEWWSTIPPIPTKFTFHFNSLSDELKWEVMFVDIGWIVNHHSMTWGERWFLLILVELPKLIEWWSTILPISTKITSHFNSLNDDQQLHQYQQKSPLILTHWMMVNNPWVKVRGDVCWYWWNCWPSFNELRWEVIFVDIGGIVDHHSMSWSEM
jgi:hypothetical protein